MAEERERKTMRKLRDDALSQAMRANLYNGSVCKGDNGCCCGMGQQVRMQHETQLYAVVMTAAKKQ